MSIVRYNEFFSYLIVEDNSREIIQSACRSIGSTKDNEFDVRFNPDLFQPHVTLNQSVKKNAIELILWCDFVFLVGRNRCRYEIIERSCRIFSIKTNSTDDTRFSRSFSCTSRWTKPFRSHAFKVRINLMEHSLIFHLPEE